MEADEERRGWYRSPRVQPKWIGDGVWNALVAHWGSSDFGKVSDQNKKNKASEKGGSLHTGGFISQAQHHVRMRKELRREIGIHELHCRTHMRKGTQDFVDERSKKTQEEFEERMSQYRQSQTESSDASTIARTPQQEQEAALKIWVEVVGGKKKGYCYGLADYAANYPRKGGSSSGIGLSRFSTQEEREMEHMRQRVAYTKEAIGKVLSSQHTLLEMVQMMQSQGMPPPQWQSPAPQQVQGIPPSQPLPPPPQWQSPSQPPPPPQWQPPPPSQWQQPPPQQQPP